MNSSYYYMLIQNFQNKIDDVTNKKKLLENYLNIVTEFNQNVNDGVIKKLTDAKDSFSYGYINDDGKIVGEDEITSVLETFNSINNNMSNLILEIQNDIKKYNENIVSFSSSKSWAKRHYYAALKEEEKES